MRSTGSTVCVHRGHRWGAVCALAFALPLVVLAGTADAGAKLHRDDRATIKVDGQTRLVIKNDRGQTVVVGEKDAKVITVVADYYVRAESDDEAKDLMKRLTYVVGEGEGEIVIDTRRPDHKKVHRGLLSILRGVRSDAYIDYTIEVPRRLGVATWATSGDARISNISGDAEVHATSGNVELREVGGAAKVELTSGAVKLREIGGDVRMLSSSGSLDAEGVGGSLVMQATAGNVSAKRISGDCQVQLITGDLDLDGCLGNLNFQTSTGDAHIFDVDGSISAVSSSGDMNIMILPVGEKKFAFSSSSGDIDVFYPPRKNYGFLLDVATGTGSIEGDLAIKVDEINRRRLKGIVGNGESRVTIETSSGDVTIAERPAKRRK